MAVPSLTVNVNGLNQVSADGLNTFQQVCDNMTQLRAFIGATGMKVYVGGFTVNNDGGAGNFYWNASGTGPDDNGITNVVPNGSTSGCWTRIGSGSGGGTIVNSIDSPGNTITLSAATGAVDADINLSHANTWLANQLIPLADGSTAVTQAAGDSSTKVANTAFVAGAVLPTPKGRLTLSTNTPVMIADVTAASAIYYTPYIGNTMPIYNGSAFSTQSFSQLTLTLDASAHLSTKLYDIFVFLNSGVVTIAAGPAWTSSTARSAAISQLSGIWTNTAIINLTNSSTTYSNIPANQATYVGTFYATANGQTGVALKPSAASGGTANIIGLYNAYNRIQATGYCRDNTATWSYGTTTWRSANNSTSNRISFVDGLQQSFAFCSYAIVPVTAADTTAALIGINIDSTSTTPNVTASSTSAAGATSAATSYVNEAFYPVLGFHFIQAVEYATASTTYTAVNSSQQIMALTVTIDI